MPSSTPTTTPIAQPFLAPRCHGKPAQMYSSTPILPPSEAPRTTDSSPRIPLGSGSWSVVTPSTGIVVSSLFGWLESVSKRHRSRIDFVLHVIRSETIHQRGVSTPCHIRLKIIGSNSLLGAGEEELSIPGSALAGPGEPASGGCVVLG